MPRNPNRGRFRKVDPRRTRSQQLLIERLNLNLLAVQDEDIFDYNVQAQVPKAWDTLEKDIDVEEPKVKLTLYLDTSVAKFYRAMGKGYHARINRILATFAQMRMGQIKRIDDMFADELAEIEELRRKDYPEPSP